MFVRPVSLQKPVRVNVLPGGEQAGKRPPAQFRFQGKVWNTVDVRGFERIAPEWWWDHEDWRTGSRDYWQVATDQGQRLWMFCTSAAPEPAWYLHGVFA